MRIVDLIRSIEMRLASNPLLAEREGLTSEAEQLVLAAYRRFQKPMTRFELYANSATEVDPDLLTFALAQSRHRTEGFPLQYLTETQQFLDHEYRVGPGVLIPRPETEILAVTAIEFLRNRAVAPPVGHEIGTGSGILSIELLSAFPSLIMHASELSGVARGFAQENAKRVLGSVDRFSILSPRSPLEVLEPFDKLPPPDFLISNPPYLDPAQNEATRDVAQHEPHEALFAPPLKLLHFYEAFARSRRIPTFLEIPHERARAIELLFGAMGWKTRLVSDLTGRERVLIAE